MQTLEGMREMKAEAEQKINKIMAEVWGVETEAINVIEKDEATEGFTA